MSSPTTTEDLLDLKLLPAWVNEPARPNDYANFEGEDERSYDRGGQRPTAAAAIGSDGRRDHAIRAARNRANRAARNRATSGLAAQGRTGAARGVRMKHRGRDDRRERPAPVQPIAVTVRFLPHAPAFNSVIAQIKSGSVAYSVFALARLFLEKPERYDVQLTTAEDRPLFQLGENGAVASDRAILEASAFASARDDFYTVEVTQSEPLKGNFTNVARCRLSGTLLGPTNHHNYQPQLRTLYETRFSRRMSFADYQKQIEIVSDPAVVEEWKEQARNVTTYTAKTGEPPLTFTNAAEVERHFRQHHLPGLVRSASELTIGGVMSRRLPDRALGRAIEEAWSSETRSPSKMMQELSARIAPGRVEYFPASPRDAFRFAHSRAGFQSRERGRLRLDQRDPGNSDVRLGHQPQDIGRTPGAGRRRTRRSRTRQADPGVRPALAGQRRLRHRVQRWLARFAADETAGRACCGSKSRLETSADAPDEADCRRCSRLRERAGCGSGGNPVRSQSRRPSRSKKHLERPL